MLDSLTPARPAAVYDASRAAVLKVVPGSGATVTVTEVLSPDATSNGATDVTSEATAAAGHAVRWAFYRVAVTGGSATVSLVGR